MSFFKNAVIVMICAVFVYNVVDDKTRKKFDNGIERQNIQMVVMKNSAYLFIWEFLGAHEEELAREIAIYDADIKKRKALLKEKIDAVEDDRLPAQDDSKKFDKFLPK